MDAVRELRIGILSNGAAFREWQAPCAENLLAVESVRPAIVIMDTRPPLLVARLKTRFLSLCNRHYGQPRSQASRRLNLSNTLAGTPQIRRVAQIRGKVSEYFDYNPSAAVRERAGRILKRIVRPTILHSYPANRDFAHDSVTWPADICRHIVARRAGRLDSAAVLTTAPTADQK